MNFIKVTQQTYKSPNEAVSTHHPDGSWSWEPATPEALSPNPIERFWHWCGYHISFGQPYCVICLLAADETSKPDKLHEQFPSKGCACAWSEPYGWVPEADCEHHDTVEFSNFVSFLESRAKGVEHVHCTLGCPYYTSGHSINADGQCNMGCC
jgi:hypothetical protein